MPTPTFCMTIGKELQGIGSRCDEIQKTIEALEQERMILLERQEALDATGPDADDLVVFAELLDTENGEQPFFPVFVAIAFWRSCLPRIAFLAMIVRLQSPWPLATLWPCL